MNNRNNWPLVSVYIPTHNRSDLLFRAIQSVQNQTYPSLEILVSDDASTDGTEQIVNALTSTSRVPIRYFRSTSPKGACVARNIAISAASGHYITGLDDDDIFHEQRIELLTAGYDPRYSCVCAGALPFRTPTEYTEVRRVEGKNGFKLIPLESVLYENFVGNQVLTETSRLREIGGFDANAKAWQDYDTWVRLIERFGPAKKLNRFLYFMDEGHDANRITNSANRLTGARQFAQKHGHRMSKWHHRSHDVTTAMMQNKKLSALQLINLFNLGGYRTWGKLALYSLANVRYKW